ncbi:MAG: GNAT family N-acetyltransferase [Panacagrimonas sp.]
MDGVRVRRARPDDATEILRLESLFPSDRMSPRSVRRFLKSDSARVWVAEREGHVLGNLVLLLRRNSDAARIYSVIVDPTARGLGLGHRLVERAENEAHRLGRKRIVLEVRSDNAAAHKLYARRDYAVARELPAYYDDGAEGLRLTRSLTGEVRPVDALRLSTPRRCGQ